MQLFREVQLFLEEPREPTAVAERESLAGLDDRRSILPASPR
ncbi:MAG TPA: hypothetical protein VFP52_10450 [Myxococcales bacterium]|nr:hypothetical protein [Myxococcales bacterium]